MLGFSYEIFIFHRHRLNGICETQKYSFLGALVDSSYIIRQHCDGDHHGLPCETDEEVRPF